MPAPAGRRRRTASLYAGGVSPFWIWMQVLIVVVVVAGMVIATIRLV
jgi:hypothetical protein